MRLLELADVNRAPLANELDATCARCSVIEGDEHHVGKVQTRQFHVEHFRGRLDLRLQPVRRAAEHHHRTGEFQDELLPAYNLRNMTCNLGSMPKKTTQSVLVFVSGPRTLTAKFPLTQISAFLRFLRFSFFSSPLSYSSVPNSVAGVLGTVLGVPNCFKLNFGRSLSEAFHPRLPEIPGVIGEAEADAVSSLGVGGPDSGGEPARDSNIMLCGRESDFRCFSESFGSLLSKEYLHIIVSQSHARHEYHFTYRERW